MRDFQILSGGTNDIRADGTRTNTHWKCVGGQIEMTTTTHPPVEGSAADALELLAALMQSHGPTRSRGRMKLVTLAVRSALLAVHANNEEP